MIPNELRALRQWASWIDDGGRKLPICPSTGRHASSTDPTTWDTYEAAKACGNIGFVFTRTDPYVGIDIDDCVDRSDGGYQLNERASEIILAAGPFAYVERSPSGDGIHIIVKGPHLESGRRKDGVEVYSHSRYFTVTENEFFRSPQVIGEGEDLLWKLLGPSQDAQDAPRTRCASVPCQRPDNAFERATAYVESVPGAVSGSMGHDHTYALACRLAIDFAMSEAEMWKLMEPWNRTCSPPWETKDLKHKIDSALRKASSSTLGGAYAMEDDETIAYDVAGILASASKRSDPFPEDLLSPPGALGLFTDWAMSQNHRRNRILSLLGGIAWMSHLTGRRIQDTAGIRTNLYIIGIAPSSGGKQALLECIKLLTDLGHRPDSVIGKVTSDSAIAHQLKCEPSSLCLWDEFGLFLQKTAKAGPLTSIQDVLLELWGATRTTWKAKKYVNSDSDLKVQQPCFSLLGMTTPDHFWSGLTRMHMKDGFAGRLLVVDSGPRADRGSVLVGDPPKALLDIERMWTGASLGNLSDIGLAGPSVPIAKVSTEAEGIFEELLDRIDEETDDDRASIWGRAIEKARKLALIYACSRSLSTRAVTVDEEAATWGTRLAIWATESFLNQAGSRLTGGEGHHANTTRDVMAEIQRIGRASKKDLLNATGVDAKLLMGVLATLEEAGRISRVTKGKQVVYVLC